VGTVRNSSFLLEREISRVNLPFRLSWEREQRRSPQILYALLYYSDKKYFGNRCNILRLTVSFGFAHCEALSFIAVAVEHMTRPRKNAIHSWQLAVAKRLQISHWQQDSDGGAVDSDPDSGSDDAFFNISAS
jgi:hypothetical protein